MSVSATPQDNNLNVGAEVVSNDPPKRRRGRPRKHPLPEGGTPAPAQAALPDGKRRRGRPPKVREEI